MEKKEMNSKDLLLSFLFSPGTTNKINEPIIGRTKLTKMMFLFEKQIYKPFFQDEISIDLPLFEPYYFGPFSRQLFEDLSFFQSIGLVITEETDIPLSTADKVEFEEAFDETDEWEAASFDEEEEKNELSYSLSKGGVAYVKEKIWGRFSQSQRDKLQEFKKQINLISLDSLLRYVYNKYPEDARKSLIADKYIKKEDE